MIISVHVKPNAKKTSVEQMDDDTFKVSVTVPPEKGKANAAVIEALSDFLGIKKSAISLVRGQSTRLKQFRVEGLH